MSFDGLRKAFIRPLTLQQPVLYYSIVVGFCPLLNSWHRVCIRRQAPRWSLEGRPATTPAGAPFPDDLGPVLPRRGAVYTRTDRRTTARADQPYPSAQ